MNEKKEIVTEQSQDCIVIEERVFGEEEEKQEAEFNLSPNMRIGINGVTYVVIQVDKANKKAIIQVA